MRVILDPAERPNACCYYILNTVNERIYVGITAEVRNRLMYHRYGLYHGKHHNKALQRDWDIYGPDNFEFGVLVYLGPYTPFVDSIMGRIERLFQRTYQSSDPRYGYNNKAASITKHTETAQ